MALPDVEAVLEFLRRNGLKEAEKALKEDVRERSEVCAFDFERFVFQLPPPVRIPGTFRRSVVEEKEGSANGSCSDSNENDEFVSLGSSTSEFVNPYGIGSASLESSDASSDRLSQFGTARDYHDLDIQNDFYWHEEKDEEQFMTPCFDGSDFYGFQSEDKFIMTLEKEKHSELPPNVDSKSEGSQIDPGIEFLDKPCLFNMVPVGNENPVELIEYFHLAKYSKLGGLMLETKNHTASPPLCKCCEGEEKVYGVDPVNFTYLTSKENGLDDLHIECGKDFNTDHDVSNEHVTDNNSYATKKKSRKGWDESFKGTSDVFPRNDEVDFYPNIFESSGVEDSEETGELDEPEASQDEEAKASDELLMYSNEDEFEVFELRIIHRKNRTGFEENKDLPIKLNTVIAGRYYVTEYLGSAAFSNVVQAHDLYTGIDVCLKIIKNDKDFFDQSLDEIKLLKLVNRNDPADEHHILRLYDYFYHQEHLFIVTELLRANLYEFQKYNMESGGEAYFTLTRLQFITRQCLEALEYLHDMGIIHCDLKPENILVKSYRRCEVKVIDLGSSCFRTDNLCLYVQSRSYRAPEVILGLPYNQKIDLWSLGCILAELCSGEVLFPNETIVMILARMISVLGPFDLDMLEKGQETDKFFTKGYDLYYINEETNQVEYIIPEESSLEHHLQVSDVGFTDFVRHLLEVNPERRPTAQEALRHPWLSRSY